MSSSLAGVRAAAKAGLAATPLPKHAVGPGLRILTDTDGVPALPPVDFVVRARDDNLQPRAVDV